ncbi:hypothetical protein MLD38_038651 [Melastoma candidum]|uniref:Uncharacterized protein n=1 Tax=Melastoma candidum TaxID=119954 RepID=A0ACB9KZK4_9MYRT|nr:hypothetical protein MLD38_038651 [Melastoma candidum]
MTSSSSLPITQMNLTVHAVRTFIRKQIASELKSELLGMVAINRSSEEYVFNHPNMARQIVVNKWYGPQAVWDIPGKVENVKKPLNHPAFGLRNPNKVYLLI